MHGQMQELLLIASFLFTLLGEMLSLISSYPLSRQLYALGYRPEKKGYAIYSSRARGINHIIRGLILADKRLRFTLARIPQATGSPKDGFLLTTLKTLFRLLRVLLDLYKCILNGAIKFVAVWSSLGRGEVQEAKFPSTLHFRPDFSLLHTFSGHFFLLTILYPPPPSWAT